MQPIDIPRTELGAGIRIPALAKGNWQLAARHGAAFDRDAAIAAMREHVEAGIDWFDCADHYVGVEELIGEFRRRHPDLARRLRISTKVVPDLEALASVTRADVARIVDTSLVRLGVERLDLAQFHWWDYAVPRDVEVLQWLADLQAAGKIALLGTTNMDRARLAAYAEAGIRVAANQLQYSLLDRRPEHGLAAQAAGQGTQLLCYGTLAGGFLDERWLGQPDPAPPLANRSLVKYRLIVEDFGGWAALQALLQVLHGIAQRHAAEQGSNVRIGSVALRWVLGRQGVACAIVGARNADRLASTLAALRLTLTAQDHAEIDALLAAHPGPAGDCYDLERQPGGAHSSIMWKNQNAHGAPQDPNAYVPPLPGAPR